MLRSLTKLSPVVLNVTRWSGKYRMLESFVQICDKLIEVVKKEGSTVFMDKSEGFAHQVKKFAKILSEINVITLELQTRGATLSDCRFSIDTLTDAVYDGLSNADSSFYGCNLHTNYITIDSSIATEALFESGVVKIQRNETCSLNSEEKLRAEFSNWMVVST